MRSLTTMFWAALPDPALGFEATGGTRWETAESGIIRGAVDRPALGSAQPAWAETTLAAKAMAVAAIVMCDS